MKGDRERQAFTTTIAYNDPPACLLGIGLNLA